MTGRIVLNGTRSRGLRTLALTAAVVWLMSAPNAWASSGGPPNARTKAPKVGGGVELTCNSFLCHNTFPLNSGEGVLEIVGPELYVPGQIYQIFVTLTHPEQMRWGFEMTAIDDALLGGVGTFFPDNILTQVSSTGDRDYVKQKSAGTFFLQTSAEWSFDWQAPDDDVGPISFYAAGNAANGNGSNSGDFIYTAMLTVPEPSASSLGLAATTVLLGLAQLRRSRSAPHRNPSARVSL